MSHILVVEDESAIAELISINLRHAGFEVTIAATTTYANQPSRPDGPQVPKLTTPAADQPDPRIDTVYLDVFLTEVDGTTDPALANSEDVGMQTSVRLKPEWSVLVAEVGFEPTISCFRSRRNCQAFPYADRKSAQRESNPHIRHGKAVGCRYIMGACFVANSIVKEQ